MEQKVSLADNIFWLGRQLERAEEKDGSGKVAERIARIQLRLNRVDDAKDP